MSYSKYFLFLLHVRTVEDCTFDQVTQDLHHCGPHMYFLLPVYMPSLELMFLFTQNNYYFDISMFVPQC